MWQEILAIMLISKVLSRIFVPPKKHFFSGKVMANDKSQVVTKRGLGHGHGLPYGLPYGLPVVDFLKLVSALL